MMDEIHNLIDRKLSVISSCHLFIRYFASINLNKIDNSFYLTNKSSGIEIVLTKDLFVSSIHLFSGKTGDYGTFEGELPLGLTFFLNRNEIQKEIGNPKKSGGGHRALYIGDVPVWDKYYFEEYSLHLQYATKDGSIDVITIASLKLEEYFNSALQ